MTKPNILILMCDQMQARRMGFVDGIAYTPNLDALAAEGVHFTNAITVHGQCVPSRCALMTGMSPHECNVMVNYGFFNHCGHLTTKNRTFVNVFRDAGYTTAHFGKSHLGSPLKTMGFDVGECLDGHFPKGHEPIERIRVHEELHSQGIDSTQGEWPQTSTHYKYLKQGLDWLTNHEPGGKPLLFMFDTNLPHPPFYFEDEWRERFKPDEMVLPKSYYEETFEGKPAFLKKHVERGPHKLESESKLREEMAQYYTMISAVDKACGQVIELFKQKGLWDNTVVLFLSDHGDMMGGHRFTRKGTMPYEELYNIPCILKLPVGMASRRKTIDDVIVSTDFGAALLELAGIEGPEPFDNNDMVRALHRDHAPEDGHVFFEHYAAWWGLHPFYGVRTATMKYVRYYGDDNTEELYDLAKDPDELHCVAFDPAYKKQKDKLAALADDWWARTCGQSVDFYESDAFRYNLNRPEGAVTV
ncbi:MAG: sulfatase-like hydrolase/transferase [Phycisphaera sp.]|nr:sulfatase-like hydrolase/transferase [Phycisphaera sp.]